MQPNQNPNLQPQPVSPNQVPSVPAEQAPVAPPAPERQPAPAAPEVAPQAPAQAPPPPQQPVAVPPPPAPIPPGVTPAPPVAAPQAPPPAPPVDNPATAGDVDVIEKEWVDQADKVIKRTQDDPYVEEEAVESLQQDYLKKRYNHDVKKPDGQ